MAEIRFETWQLLQAEKFLAQTAALRVVPLSSNTVARGDLEHWRPMRIPHAEVWPMRLRWTPLPADQNIVCSRLQLACPDRHHASIQTPANLHRQKQGDEPLYWAVSKRTWDWGLNYCERIRIELIWVEIRTNNKCSWSGIRGFVRCIGL